LLPHSPEETFLEYGDTLRGSKRRAEGFLEVDTADKILVGAYSWVDNALIGQTVFIVYVCRIRIFIDMLAVPDHFASQEGGLGDFRRLVVCKG
jgi:hypothetical protein